MKLQFWKDLVFFVVVANIIACMYYRYSTSGFPTPYTDSITPQQEQLRDASTELRRPIYYQGLGIGALVAWYWFQPFEFSSLTVPTSKPTTVPTSKPTTVPTSKPSSSNYFR